VDLERVAVGVDGHGAVLVGPKDFGSGLAVAVQHGRNRVAETVGSADAHDGDARLDRADELGGAGGEAAVMRNLDGFCG
jgi:hypothetical protein